jgi:hypothetical protein
VMRVLGRLDYLEWARPGRPLLQAYGRARLRPIFERVGWDAAPGESLDQALLRPRLIRMLGDFGDEALLAEARRRFAAFLKDPAMLAPDLRDPVTHLAGRNADRATYDALLALGRQTTSTEERMRYYGALASALDPDLARATLDLALTDELPPNLASQLISWVAGSAEHRDLAWDFVKANFDRLAARSGPSFRDYFVAGLMRNFSDAAHAAELMAFPPAQATPGGRIAALRAQEAILTNADFAREHLAEIDDWLKNAASP